MVRKMFYYGPFLDEGDGGAVVNHITTQKINQLSPRDEIYGYPKVIEELNPSMAPWVQFPILNNKSEIPYFMSVQQIPLLNLFHIGREEFEPMLDVLHSLGGKAIIWQTIHWKDDEVTKSKKLKDFDMVVAPTNYAKRVMESICGVPANKSIYIPHGVDTTRYYRRETVLKESLGIKPHQKVILYSGRLSYWKGMQSLIPIMRKLYRKHDCVFIIRGSAYEGNREGRALNQIFSRLSYNNPNLIFLNNWQSPEFMEELFAMTDILVFNSGHEGFGMPLIEAQAVGAVPVTTALANHVEICGNTGQTSILLDPVEEVGKVNDNTPIKIASSNAVYGAIEWLLSNPEEMVNMGRKGVANVKSRYDLNDVAKSFLSLYDKLIPEGYDMSEEIVKRLS